MGRKTWMNLPPRMRARRKSSGIFYYYEVSRKPSKEIPLGKDYVLAMKQWAELELDQQLPDAAQATFFAVAERYQREVLPTKAPRTQRDNLAELKWLLQFFNDPPATLDAIKPVHIRQYLDWRKDSPVRANREIALFSHIFNAARQWGYIDTENPVRGVRKFKETGRDIYITDQVYKRVWDAADAPLRDAMDLAYLTGQRPADVLKMSERDLEDGALLVKQNKTSARIRIEVVGELATVIARIHQRKARAPFRALALIVDETGHNMTYAMLRRRLDKARAAAGVRAGDFQLRDLRAKAGTDTAEVSGAYAAKNQLGHGSVIMTEHYIRKRGQRVKPTR